MHDVRCRGCLTLLGVSVNLIEASIYCSEQCAEDYPVRPQEQRDSLITALVEQGQDVPTVAGWFGITRQYVYKIVSTRDVRKEVPTTKE